MRLTVQPDAGLQGETQILNTTVRQITDEWHLPKLLLGSAESSGERFGDWNTGGLGIINSSLCFQFSRFIFSHIEYRRIEAYRWLLAHRANGRAYGTMSIVD